MKDQEERVDTPGIEPTNGMPTLDYRGGPGCFDTNIYWNLQAASTQKIQIKGLEPYHLISDLSSKQTPLPSSNPGANPAHTLK